MNTVDEILDFAIEREQEAADFYADLARRAEKGGMKSVLLGFAEEEQRHKAKLLAVKDGQGELTPHQEVIDLKIVDYLVEVEPGVDISFQDALIHAMKREKAAFELYTDMAAKVTDATLREVCRGLAKEESRHKLYFESEYDERVLRDN